MQKDKELKERIIELEQIVSSGIKDDAMSGIVDLLEDYPGRYEAMIVCAQYYMEIHEYLNAALVMDQCLELFGDDVEVLKFSYDVYSVNKLYDKCIDVSKRYIAIVPNDYRFYEKYAYSYQKLGDYRQALLIWQFLDKKNKITSTGLSNLADCVVQLNMGIDNAVGYSMRAIEMDTNSTKAALRLGQMLSFYGESEYAATCFKSYALKCLERNVFDFSTVYSNYLFFINYNKEGIHSVESIYDDHKNYSVYLGEKFIKPSSMSGFERGSSKIRVGIVSADFYVHPVAFFLLPVLENIDQERFEIILYSATSERVQDRLTKVFKNSGFKWVDISAISDVKTFEIVKDDRNHLLFDLSGHTAGNRLACFASRMAPCQVNWLGYPNTTGLQNMDYRIVDSVTDPTEYADDYASEELIRIEGSFLCYKVPDESSEFNPKQTTGTVIFSTYNNLLKISDKTLGLWSKVLSQVNDSKLVLKYQYTGDLDVSSYLFERMLGCSIDVERVQLLPAFKNFEDHLHSYNNVDISLDPFPYNGTTSTCEALVMGVPVVTLMGESHASRVSSSILKSIGLDELVATSEDDYVKIAVSLAAKGSRLFEYKHIVRNKLLKSPLVDEVGFANKFEKCLEDLYKRTFSVA